MDGNFSAEHMRCRPGEQDTPLSSGMAFMANPDSYNKHLHSGKEIIQVCTWMYFPQFPAHVVKAKHMQYLQGH